MKAPKRSTRRKIAYWNMGLLTLLVLNLFVPGDMATNDLAFATLLAPLLTGIAVTFIGGETYSDYSARVHKTED